VRRFSRRRFSRALRQSARACSAQSLPTSSPASVGYSRYPVVPVPLHWRRRRARGYDQAALLAGPVAKALGVVPLLRGLRRVRDTRSQVELPHRERYRNIAGAFAPRRLDGFRRVLLLDDVRTTGATLGAASDALAEGGVTEVYTFVLAVRVLNEGT